LETGEPAQLGLDLGDLRILAHMSVRVNEFRVEEPGRRRTVELGQDRLDTVQVLRKLAHGDSVGAQADGPRGALAVPVYLGVDQTHGLVGLEVCQLESPGLQTAVGPTRTQEQRDRGRAGQHPGRLSLGDSVGAHHRDLTF
jgi:hypothetical protein